jgi:hypothetical protein
MDVYSTELGIWLSFVKTSEFLEGGFNCPPPPRFACLDCVTDELKNTETTRAARGHPWQMLHLKQPQR